ncbi:MAG: S8 family serine peptidase, partial [bacterium]
MQDIHTQIRAATLIHFLAAVVVAAILEVATAPALAGSPIVVPISDRDGDKLADSLKLRATKGQAQLVERNGVQQLSLLVALSVAPAAGHRQRVEALGGTVVKTWSDLVYALEIALPPAALDAYVSSEPDLVEVTENGEMRGALMISSRQIGARAVWTGLTGFTGNPSQSIAILDTGVDDSHMDLPPALLDSNQVGDSVPPGWDGAGHGTHVAGVALGRGTSAGLEDYSISVQQHFPTTTGTGFSTLFPVRVTGGARNISMNVNWGSAGSGVLELDDEDTTPLNSTSGASPLALIQSVSGVTDQYYRALPGASTTPPTGDAYTLQVNAAYEALGDGQPILQGIAPSCGLVSIRVLPDSATGSLSAYVNGLTVLNSVRKTHQTIVANASLSSNAVSDVVDTATNNAVDNGILVVIAAGNGQQSAPEEFVGSPGTASKALTVGAINRSDSVSNFSSRG